jgi:hypothetical protein
MMGVFWFILIPLLFLSSLYVFHTWWQVRGVTGLALAVLALALGTDAVIAAILDGCWQYVDAGILILASCKTVVPLGWIVWIRRGSDALKMITIVLLVDAYAARMNGHRAITTVAYEWYRRVSQERRTDRSEMRHET